MPTTFDKHPSTEFSKLNEKQLRAVELTGGPMLVLASPVAGKYHDVIFRFGRNEDLFVQYYFY